jgi:hypothetical protein
MLTKNGNQPVPFRLRQSNGLHGKVALVVCDREEGVRSLVTGLAQKGVDIALACKEEPCQDSIRETVEAKGRRFLAIGGQVNSAAVVEQIVRVFGHLDLFIDCSTSGERGKEEQEHSLGGVRSGQLGLFTNTALTTAALQALAG